MNSPRENRRPLPHGTGNVHASVSPECRARRIGIVKDFCECMTRNNAGCEFKFPFGDATFCRHPRWPEIVEQTPPPAATRR
jgi:hypothetical protein